MLRLFALQDRCPNVRITAVMAVWSAQRFGGGQRCEDGRHPLQTIAESHVIIPFIVNREGLDATRNGMIR